MKKVLVISNLGRHFRLFGHYDYKVLLDLGFEVHIAANFSDKVDYFEDNRVIKHQINFKRTPFNPLNLVAYFKLKKLFKSHFFHLIQTQSPTGGFYSRLAAIKTRKKGTKVIYTAHGFHFYKGASFFNWAIFFVFEKILGYFTDCLITINSEDYFNAKKFKISNKIEYIPGVGIDLEMFKNQTNEIKKELRFRHGFKNDDFILISVAELNKNKNQKMLIRVMDELIESYKNIILLLVGDGKYHKKYLKKIKKCNLENNVKILGYRSDIPKLLLLTDVFVTASQREGLPLSVMEAMATGLPVIATDCRGNRDLVRNNINGFLVKINDVSGFAKSIEKLYSDKQLCNRFGYSSSELIKQYDISNVSNKMKKIYNTLIN